VPTPRSGNRADADTTMGGMSSSSPSSSALHRVSGRIGGIAESATLKVDAKAKALKAGGRPVIGFGAGEPDFPTPDYIVEAAVEACRDPRNHRYTPAGGLPELKAAIVEKTLRDSGYDVEPAQVLVTNGGKQAIYAAFAALVDPGDEVILPAPYWTTYPEAIRLAGGVPVEVLADETQDYKVTVEQLEAARTERTQVLLSFARDGSFTLDVSSDPNWLKLRLPRYDGNFIDRVVLFVDGREIRPSSIEFVAPTADGLATYRMHGSVPSNARTLRWYFGMVVDPYPLAIRRADGRVVVEEIAGDAWSGPIDLRRSTSFAKHFRKHFA